MDSKSKSYFDELDDDLNVDQQENTFHKMLDELNTAVTKQSNFEKSVSVEAYIDRGFIKEGDLVNRFTKKGEQRDNLTKLIVSDWTSEYGHSVKTNDYIIKVYGYDGNIGVYVLSSDQVNGAEVIEEQLLKIIDSNPKDFSNKEVSVYVFAPFTDSEVSDIVSGDYYEFKGCFEFVKAQHDWVLLKHHRAVHMPINQEK